MFSENILKCLDILEAYRVLHIFLDTTFLIVKLVIINPATPNCCQLYPNYLALTKKKFSQIGQELRGALSHGSNWRWWKKNVNPFFSPREVNVRALYSPNNWPSYSKLLSTIATLSGLYQKKIQPNRSRIKWGSGLPVIKKLETAKRDENHIYLTGETPDPEFMPRTNFFANQQYPKHQAYQRWSNPAV